MATARLDVVSWALHGPYCPRRRGALRLVQKRERERHRPRACSESTSWYSCHGIYDLCFMFRGKYGQGAPPWLALAHELSMSYFATNKVAPNERLVSDTSNREKNAEHC